MVDRIKVKSVAAEWDTTEPVDVWLSGNSTRGKAVEKARQKKISMGVDANFIFEILLSDRIPKGRSRIQC